MNNSIVLIVKSISKVCISLVLLQVPLPTQLLQVSYGWLNNNLTNFQPLYALYNILHYSQWRIGSPAANEYSSMPTIVRNSTSPKNKIAGHVNTLLYAIFMLLCIHMTHTSMNSWFFFNLIIAGILQIWYRIYFYNRM